MRLTRYFLPLLRETPAEAQIASHRLMLRAGMIRQASAGIYSWLPLGYKVLRRIEAIVHEEQQRAGHIPLLMPTLQSAELWRESGRYDDYGAEMLRHQGPARARHALRADQRGADHRHLPLGGDELQGAAADALPHPVEVPRRGAAAVRGDARAASS